MSAIVDVIAREILDSRGNPTVEADVLLESGVMGRAAVPSGASTGSREAIELRDGDAARYLGKGVLQAVENINTEISEGLVGLDAEEQAFIDRTLIELDGTENKSRLGANATLAVSMAVARAAADEAGLPLYRYFGGMGAVSMPVPMMNVINGGAHANNSLDIQECMIMPVSMPSFREALRCGTEIFHHLKKLVDRKGYPTTVGDEGGFAPNVTGTEEALNLIQEAISNAGYEPGTDVLLALDCAASEFYKDGSYVLAGEGSPSPLKASPTTSPRLPTSSRSSRSRTPWPRTTGPAGSISAMRLAERSSWSATIFRDQHEDPATGHRPGYRQLDSHQDQPDRHPLGNLRCGRDGQARGLHRGDFHRSGETEDSTISDIAVGLNAMQIKTGSLSRSDRISKYNQLLRIEEDLGDVAVYPGLSAFYNLRKR